MTGVRTSDLVRFAGAARLRTMSERHLQGISFGTTAAVVTSMGMSVGLNAATATKSTIVSGLLIIAIADNISDSLSIHVYQESEGLEGRSAFRATITNFLARLCATGTFVGLVIALPSAMMGTVLLVWGLVLLSALTYFLARARGVSVVSEIAKHVTVALFVVFVSKTLGGLIRTYLG
jgi:VIT1/CCC1 family predicted Fe2+/Mn2+ transporter